MDNQAGRLNYLSSCFLTAVCSFVGCVFGILAAWLVVNAYCQKLIADSSDPSTGGAVGYIAVFALIFILPIGALGGLSAGALIAEIVAVLIAGKNPIK